MSTWLILLIAIPVLVAGGYVFRAIGQMATGNKPYFRDMTLGVAVGFVLAAVLLLLGAWYYFQPKVLENGLPNAGVTFFRWAVHGIVIFAIAAWVFRFLGRMVGTEGSKKLFRSMPLTASFGVLVVLVYAFVSIFAGQAALWAVFTVAFVGLSFAGVQATFDDTRGAMRALKVTGVLVAIALAMWIIGPLAPYGQEDVLGSANVVPGGDPNVGGDPAYPLGTDQIGRDILSRLIYGAQNTVGIAFVTTLLAFFIGGSLGFLAATLGGWLDQILSRSVDALMAIPALIFALLLMTIATVWANEFGINRTYFMVVIIAVIDSTRVYRLARAVGQNIVVMDYIEAAKLRGEGLGYLIFREMLPNATAPLLAEFGLRFCFVFLTIASLSFLGVGIQPPLADWGTMVKDLSLFISSAPYLPLVGSVPLLPAGAIALLTIGVNFVVDWMLHRSSGLKE